MQFNVLKKLIEWAEKYEQSNTNEDWTEKDLLEWLFKINLQENWGVEGNQSNTEKPDGLIAMFLGMMYNFLSFYARRLFKGTLIYSIDDFGVLTTLYPDIQLSKTEVMRQNVMEKASGNEVLKRMLRLGLLEEHNHPNDRRSKLIGLTDLGKKTLDDVIDGIAKLSELVTGNLSEEEKKNLLKILAKLHAYHQPIFEKANQEELKKMLGMG